MRASDALREEFANLYITQMDWQQAATVAGLQPSHIAMQGSSFAVWTNILETVRMQNRVDGLRQLADRQHPELKPLVERYAAELARGDGELTGMPQLADFALNAADLDIETIARSLTIEQTLGSGPLRLVLGQQAPTASGIDALLAGQRTAAAKENLDRYLRQQRQMLHPVRERRSLVEKSAKELGRQIAELAQARAPSEPVLDNFALSNMPQAQQDFWRNKHADDLRAYRAADERHKTEQARLPALRSTAQAAAQELAQLDASIAAISAQSAAGERPFRQAIEEARDQDLVLKLGSMLEQAGAAFRTSAKPFKGFWTMLGAGCMLDFIEKAVTSPNSAMEARQRFVTEAAALMPLVETEVAAITRGCLAGSIVIARALAANRESVTTLAARLDQLPTAQLADGAGRARATVAVPPEIPAFDQLELRIEIDAMKQRLAELRTSASSQTERLQAELDTNLRAEVGRALGEVASIMDQMRSARQNPATLLGPSRILWIFINRGAASGELPAFTRTLCAALSLEFASRDGARPDAVLEAASSTDFALEEAQARLKTPALTNYLQSATLVRDNLAAFESHSNDIDAALVRLEFQIGLVAERYRIKLWWIAGLAVLPVVDLILAIWALRVLARLSPLVASAEPRYVGLRGDARWTMLLGAALSAVAGVAVVMAPNFWAALQTVDERWLITVGVCCVIALVLFLCGLVAALLLKPAG